MYSTPQFDAMRKTRAMTRDSLLRTKVYDYVMSVVWERDSWRKPGDVNDTTLYLLGNCPSHLTRRDMIEILTEFRKAGWANTDKTRYSPEARIRDCRQEATELINGFEENQKYVADKVWRYNRNGKMWRRV